LFLLLTVFIFFKFQIPSSIALYCTVAAAVLGGYGSLIAIFQIRSAMKGKPAVVEAPVKVAGPVTTTTGIPDVESEEFAAYLDSEAFLTLLDSEDQLKALTE